MQKSDTNAQTYIYFYLACKSYSLVRCIDTQGRCALELFHSCGFIPGPVGSRLFLPLNGTTRLDKKTYRTHYIYQRFSIPVLALPPLCIFCMLLLSLQMFVLFECKCPAKWTSQDIPPMIRSERIYSIQSAYKCARRELKLYIFTEVYDFTLVRAWRRCAVQIHEWMFQNKVNFSRFPLLRE